MSTHCVIVQTYENKGFRSCMQISPRKTNKSSNKGTEETPMGKILMNDFLE